MRDRDVVRVLHSFPHRLGRERVSTTAWHEIDSAVAAGAELTVLAADCVRPFARPVDLQTTLSHGRVRLPARAIGVLNYLALHDWLVARALPGIATRIDVVHAWPMGALRTLKAARRLDIPVALDRPNVHTRSFYRIVAQECARIGVQLPHDHEYAYNARVVEQEEQEYALASALLCPSAFVAESFRDRGHPDDKLVRFIYGVDDEAFQPEARQPDEADQPLTVLFAGLCAVLKGLHLALEAWLASGASQHGRFLIAGEFVDDYRRKLAPMLARPGVEVLGPRCDVAQLMRHCDALVLPSLAEGFGLVCTEAMASGCVPLVSNACTELCRHGENALVHPVGDVAALTRHFDDVHRDRALLARLRAAGIAARPAIGWRAAGDSLVAAYRQVVAMHAGRA